MTFTLTVRPWTVGGTDGHLRTKTRASGMETGCNQSLDRLTALLAKAEADV